MVQKRLNKTDPEIQFLGGVVKFNEIERLKLPGLTRIAFAGRSNVGKSSLLNAMTGFKVARVSAEPGKTREMNFFKWKKKILVDLPGYGFAKVSKSMREEWGREISKWLVDDQKLELIISLVDGRHGFMDSDLELVRWLHDERLPFIVAFTKMDKFKSNNQRRDAERKLKELCASLGIENYLFTSSEEKNGLASLMQVIRQIT